MATATVAVTLDETLVAALDRLVQAKIYPDRDRAIQDALREKLHRLSHTSLAAECEKLDPAAEQTLAEEGLQEETEWPEY